MFAVNAKIIECYMIKPAQSLWSDSVIKLVSDLITESDQAVRAVHSCNSWFANIFVDKM